MVPTAVALTPLTSDRSDRWDGNTARPIASGSFGFSHNDSNSSLHRGNLDSLFNMFPTVIGTSDETYCGPESRHRV
jgi:hypothetical protein